MMNVSKVSVGVDVSKGHLDVFLSPINKGFRVTNDKPGIRKMIQKLSKHEIKQVVFEASGGFEKNAATAVSEEEIPYWIVDPKRVKAFIISEGVKVKTDAVDARMIAKFAAEKERSYESYSKSPVEEKLNEYVKLRTQLVKTVASKKTELEMITDVDCRDTLRDVIKSIENSVKKIDKNIDALIKKDTALKAKIEIAESMPGIGRVTAATVLATMPELGKLNSKQVAALAGVAPYQNQSGKFEKRAFIKAGRPLPRRAMYMAALTAISCNEKMKIFYERLVANGKPKKVALTAVMRKMFVILNAMLREEKKWKSE